MNTKNILIVDDTVDNLRLLTTLLKKNGYNVLTAINGQMALSTAQNEVLDLILLDIMMPDVDGYTVCSTLKSNPQTANIPVVFISVLDEVLDKVKAFQAGGIDYITKPFQFQEVLVRVKNLLELKEIEQELYRLNNQLEQRVKERTLQLEVANAQLKKMAFYDSLTELPNRALLMEQLEVAFNQAQSNPSPKIAVLFIDCDRFKLINDSLGHLAGDSLLVAIARRLETLISPSNTLARLSGDEFVLIIPDLPETHFAYQVAEQILESFVHPFLIQRQLVFTNVSIGISIFNDTYKYPEDLLRDADIAMYQAKAFGRGQYQVFEPKMHDVMFKRLRLETDLRMAIHQQEFQLHYQPIINLKTGRIVSFEALVRWHHPIDNLVSPAVFIPVAEETGLICQIGYWVLREACYQLWKWNQQKLSPHPLTMSVNLSPLQLAQPDLIEQIDQVLAETQIDPRFLNLEITESAILDHPDTMIKVLKQIRERNIKLSIDDFGTGYSSLSYLHTFPVQFLKIDRSFIKPINRNPENLGLVPVIISLVKTMGLSVTAEGIETLDQLAQLKSLNCDCGQGYLFSPPLDSSRATELIQANPQW